MDFHDLFIQMLDVMDAALRNFEAAVPKHKRINTRHGLTFRFVDRSIPQALVLKIALVQSGLRAAQVLLKQGFIIEQGVLQRTVDEANEDITFLAYAHLTNKITPLHERYLAAFWSEEFNELDNPEASHESRNMVGRKKIRAYIDDFEKKLGLSPFGRAKEVIYKVNSGYVHGASTHIMEIFGGYPPRFHTRGMLGTPAIQGYTRGLWNYMHRSLNSHILIANVFGMETLVKSLKMQRQQFESLAGVNYSY